MQVQFRGDWQVQHCSNPNCRIGRLRVRPDPRRVDSWWVGRLDGRPVRQAAAEPGCLWCGENLSGTVPVGLPSPHAA